MQYPTMDHASVCLSDLSDGLSNDTFDIMRRGRQDLVQRDARAENQRIVSSRFGPAASMEFDFPTFPSVSSAAPASQVSVILSVFVAGFKYKLILTSSCRGLEVRLPSTIFFYLSKMVSLESMTSRSCWLG
jgi:hypothetical protein